MLTKELKNDPRARRTRQMLQQAITELMGEKKFTAISVQDITTRAGLNRATFYAHFVDKFDLVNSIIRERFQATLNEKLPEDATLTCANLRLMLETVYAYIAGFPGQCSPIHRQSDHALIMQQVQLQVYEGLLDWLKRCPDIVEVDPLTLEVTAMMTSWSIFGPILHASWGQRRIPVDQLINRMMPQIETSLKPYIQTPAPA